MKKLIFILYYVTTCIIYNAFGQNVKQSFFIDFGANRTFNGSITTSPDFRKHYWNNFVWVYGVTFMNMDTTSNGSIISGYKLTLGPDWGHGEIGLQNPDSTKLGDFAVATATQDLFLTYKSTYIVLSGLDLTHGYKFIIYGGINDGVVESTRYTIVGATSQSDTLQIAGPNLGGKGIHCNSSSLLTSNIIFPDNMGKIIIKVSPSIGGKAALNAMKIEEYTFPPIIPTSISLEGDDITKLGTTSEMKIDYLPINATPCKVLWKIDDTSIAKIDSDGVIIPKNNGVITVTANIFPVENKILSTSKQIKITNNGALSLYLSCSTSKDNDPSMISMNQVKDTSGLITGFYEICTTLDSLSSLKFYSHQIDSPDTVYGMGSKSGILIQGGGNIYPKLSRKTLIRADLVNGVYTTYPIDTMKITVMGSSVAYGVGATDYHGWAYMFGEMLTNRFNESIGFDWKMNNISIGGNSTTDLLKRWDSSLLPSQSQYVIYALSLTNQGIQKRGKVAFDEFIKEMQLLIYKARSAGKIPLITSAYVNSGFNSADYNYIKQLNLLIQQWDLPSFNLLGASDDGTGKWPLGCTSDGVHPKDAGHYELFLSIVPSVFDAIKKGKDLPQRVSNTEIELGKQGLNKKIVLIPENIVHSFTNSFGVKSADPGVIATINCDTGIGYLMINSTGNLVYKSPNTTTIQSKGSIFDKSWHQVTLTHYYLRGMTFLYLDSIKCDSISEKLMPQKLSLCDDLTPDNIKYREWFFYRSGMNDEEITMLNRGKMMKSSLEIYAPFCVGNQNNDILFNYAQSLNSLKFESLIDTNVISAKQEKIKIYPVPVENYLFIDGLNFIDQYLCFIFDEQGKLVKKIPSLEEGRVYLGNYSPGVYSILIVNKNTKNQYSMHFLKR